MGNRTRRRRAADKRPIVPPKSAVSCESVNPNRYSPVHQSSRPKQINLNPGVGWAVRCVTWDGTTGDCVSAGVESKGRFELAAVQVISQCFTEDAIPPPERVQLLRTLSQSNHEAGDTQIRPARQMLLAVRAADRQLHLAGMVGSPRQGAQPTSAKPSRG